MFDDIKVHSSHYAILSLWFSAGLLFITFGGRTQNQQFITMILMAMGYMVWGILHHLSLKDLTARIVLEYSLFAMLAVLLIWGIIYQA